MKKDHKESIRKSWKQVYLEPANRACKTIVPRAGLKFDLMVPAVICQYRP